MDPVIRIEELKKSFGELAAVDGLNFDIHSKEIFGILVPNGTGKTSIL
jgi:ABC-2 type transport system ATP-binding protein